MTDIVKILRAIDHTSVEDCFLQSPMFDKAADLITALRAEVERLGKGAVEQAAACGRLLRELHAAQAENEKLRAALEPFANLTVEGDEPDVWENKFPRFFRLITDARAALEGSNE